MEDTKFFACRLLDMFLREERLYVVMQGTERDQRLDVEVASEGFATEQEAEAAIRRLGGTIAEAPYVLLDHLENEEGETVWCWKDE